MCAARQAANEGGEGVMNSLWFESALLPHGWAARVRVTAANGRIGAVEVGVEATDRDERHAIGLPGLPNVHSHAFQRGLAGLTERRGAADDSFRSEEHTSELQ